MRGLADPVMVLDYLLQASTVGNQGSGSVLAMVDLQVDLGELAKIALEVEGLVKVALGFRAGQSAMAVLPTEAAV